MDKKDVLDFLNLEVFEPAIKYSKENNLPEIAKGVRFTRMRMEQLPDARAVVQYFWSAVIGTDKSIKFSDTMKKHNIVRFEDVLEEFREKFKDV